jgi:hypothetical protein
VWKSTNIFRESSAFRFRNAARHCTTEFAPMAGMRPSPGCQSYQAVSASATGDSKSVIPVFRGAHMYGLPTTDHRRLPVMTIAYAQLIMQSHLECPARTCPVKAQAKQRLIEAGQ